MEDIAALLDQLMYHAVLAFSPSATTCCHGSCRGSSLWTSAVTCIWQSGVDHYLKWLVCLSVLTAIFQVNLG